MNIKKDFIRKTILQEILNTNIENIKISSKDIDLLYDIKIKYINFQNTKKLNLKTKLKELNDINFKNVISLLQKYNVNFFLKEHEVIDINNIDKKIKNKILSNIDYFIFEKNNDFSVIFIEKKFETYKGINVNLFSVRKNPSLRILHVTNFNERHDGRLFFNTGRRINNGLIRLGHSILEFSDRDIQNIIRVIKIYPDLKS